MFKITILFILMCNIFAFGETIINPTYQQTILKKVSKKSKSFTQLPSFPYPHNVSPYLLKKEKIHIFGYGSLLNKDSASRTVSQKAVNSMYPVIAFGVKRVFNYKVDKNSYKGESLYPLERAMLNLIPAANNSLVNGVIIEVDAEDLMQLAQREVGYDLTPVLVADWNGYLDQNPNLEIQVAYTFMASNELRNGIAYTNPCYYPIRRYVKLAREGAASFGPEFLNFWNNSTYLSDGVTLIKDWDQNSFNINICKK